VIDSLDGQEIVVTATHPVHRGQRLVLQYTSETGQATSRIVHVVSCTPIACDDGMQWRLTLSPVRPESQPTR
jgi:hypothetical protein